MCSINTFENRFVSDENYVIGTHFDKNMFSITVDIDMQPHLLSKNIRPDERVEVSFDYFGMSTFQMSNALLLNFVWKEFKQIFSDIFD